MQGSPSWPLRFEHGVLPASAPDLGSGVAPLGRTTASVAATAALSGPQEGLEKLSHVEGQEGQREEIPLVQGKEQQLHFAGAAVKRYPTPKVRETQVRW